MNDIETFARKVFADQPFSAFIGARLTRAESGLAELSLRIAEHHSQQHDFVHGGVISYLADRAITFAGGLSMRHHRGVGRSAIALRHRAGNRGKGGRLNRAAFASMRTVR